MSEKQIKNYLQRIRLNDPHRDHFIRVIIPSLRNKVSGLYKCPICPQGTKDGFTNYYSYTRHLTSLHREFLPCEGSIFSSQPGLTYTCEPCARVFNRKDHYNSHMLTKTHLSRVRDSLTQEAQDVQDDDVEEFIRTLHATIETEIPGAKIVDREPTATETKDEASPRRKRKHSDVSDQENQELSEQPIYSMIAKKFRTYAYDYLSRQIAFATEKLKESKSMPFFVSELDSNTNPQVLQKSNSLNLSIVTLADEDDDDLQLIKALDQYEQSVNTKSESSDEIAVSQLKRYQQQF